MISTLSMSNTRCTINWRRPQWQLFIDSDMVKADLNENLKEKLEQKYKNVKVQSKENSKNVKEEFKEMIV